MRKFTSLTKKQKIATAAILGIIGIFLIGILIVNAKTETQPKPKTEVVKKETVKPSLTPTVMPTDKPTAQKAATIAPLKKPTPQPTQQSVPTVVNNQTNTTTQTQPAQQTQQVAQTQPIQQSYPVCVIQSELLYIETDELSPEECTYAQQNAGEIDEAIYAEYEREYGQQNTPAPTNEQNIDVSPTAILQTNTPQ